MSKKSNPAQSPLKVGTGQVRIQPDTPLETTLVPAGTTFLSEGAFAPEADSWLSELVGAGQSRSTVENYARDLRDCSEAISLLTGSPAVSTDVGDLKQQEVDRIVKNWLAENIAVSTVLRRFSAFRGFARFLWRQTGLNCVGLICARLPQMAPDDRPSIGEHAFETLASQSPVEENWIDHRDHATFLLQAATGVTTAELVALDCCHLLDGAAGIVVVNSTRATRILTTDAETSEALHKYRAILPFDETPKRPLFMNRNGDRLSTRSVQISFSRRRKDLGLPSTTNPMSVRHRLGERLAASGSSPSYVAEKLGISVKSVGRYFATDRQRKAAPSNRKQKSQTGQGTGRSGGNRRREATPHSGVKPTSNLLPSSTKEKPKMDP
jgi:integrase/recombinase XerC